MWTKYFKVIKVRPGKIVTSSHGELDFSRDNISVEICKELFESDFPYLEITEEGKKELYGIEPKADIVEETPAFDTFSPSTASRSGQDYSGGDAVGELVEPKNEHSETVESKNSPPNRRKYAKRRGSE